MSNALTSPAGKRYPPGQLIGLSLDDAIISQGTFSVLRKDSEFSPLFNYYILKGFEHGMNRRLFHKYHIEMFTNERFSMSEPQSLGPTNVMFPFIGLLSAICVSSFIAFAELIMKKLLERKDLSLNQMRMKISFENKSRMEIKNMEPFNIQ